MHFDEKLPFSKTSDANKKWNGHKTNHKNKINLRFGVYILTCHLHYARKRSKNVLIISQNIEMDYIKRVANYDHRLTQISIYYHASN